MGEVQFLLILEFELVVYQFLLVFIIILVILLSLESEVILLGNLLALLRGESTMGGRVEVVFSGGVASLQESD